MNDAVFFIALLLLEFVAPVLIVIGLIWGFFVWRRSRRERKSFAASKDDETAMSMERDRVKARRFRILSVILWLAVFAAALFLGAGLQAALGVASVCAAVCFWRALVAKARYNASFKENFVNAELSKIFDNFQYEPRGALDAESIRELGFFANCDLMEGNDLIAAEYKGIRFSQCDLVMQEKYTVKAQVRLGSEDDDDDDYKDGRGTRAETRYRDVFRGRAMRFESSRGYKGTTKVVHRDFAGKVTGGGEPVETEFGEFNENFRVFASSGVDALETLKPQVIEAIFWLARAVSAPVALHFSGRRMYAFLSMKRDAFDVSAGHTLLEERELLKRDVKLVTDFLDTMYFGADLRSGA
jgi:hypothetical protein